jgi:adenylylsulfate kinase-like enzyme
LTAGHKKVPRQHQFFGVKAAQERIAKREGGVIWHTQGSGKSIVMVLVAKWLLEHDPDARILVITDRDELDKQIEGGDEERRGNWSRVSLPAHYLAGGVRAEAWRDYAASALCACTQV